MKFVHASLVALIRAIFLSRSSRPCSGKTRYEPIIPAFKRYVYNGSCNPLSTLHTPLVRLHLVTPSIDFAIQPTTTLQYIMLIIVQCSRKDRMSAAVYNGILNFGSIFI